MIFGIQSNVWSKAHHRELMPQMIKEIALAGYDGIEIGVHRFEDLSQPQVFHDLVQSHGLHVSAIHVLEKYFFDDVLEGNQDYPRQVADFTQAVGAKYLLYSGDHRADKADPYTENLVKVLDRVGSLCQARGVTLCYHNHWWEIENDRAILKAIIDHTEPASVSICIDLAWVLRAGDSPEQVVSDYLARIKYIHLKDTLEDQWTDVGYGAVDFERVFQVIKANGREDIYATVERDEVLPDALESARRSMAKIRELGL